MSIKFIAITATTLDGKIARGPRHFSDWTSKEDKIFMRSLLDKSDVIIVGNNTYKTAKKPLSKRNCIVFSKSVNQPNSKSAKLKYVNPRKIDIKKFIQKLGYKRIAILGGAQTYTYCLKNGMLDELYLTIEPIIFGKGIDLFSSFSPSPGEKKVGVRLKDFKFKLISTKKLNKLGSLLLHYKKYKGQAHEVLPLNT